MQMHKKVYVKNPCVTFSELREVAFPIETDEEDSQQYRGPIPLGCK